MLIDNNLLESTSELKKAKIGCKKAIIIMLLEDQSIVNGSAIALKREL